ncbi:hypothetical protein BJ170DRAFT_688486 [Xylariales sp. AK1849]|nr:hypothetical protein BJ170DRAFT_688486 [Xylariales sp. AK1849]
MHVKTCVLALALGARCLAAPLLVTTDASPSAIEARTGWGILSTGDLSSESRRSPEASTERSHARGFGVWSTGDSSESSSTDSKRSTEASTERSHARGFGVWSTGESSSESSTESKRASGVSREGSQALQKRTGFGLIISAHDDA